MQDTTIINAASYHTDAASPLAPLKDTLPAAEPAFQFMDSSLTTTQVVNDTTPATVYVNFYSGHELRPVHQNLNPIEYHDVTPDWLFYILVIVMASLAWIRYNYGKMFGQTLQAIFNVNITNQIVRDENVLLQRTSAFLGIIFNVIFAITLYHVSNYFHWHLLSIDSNFGRFLFLLLLVSAVYSFKFLLLKLLGFIFSIEKEMATYIFNIFLINNMLGLLLIPLVVVLSFSVSQHTGVFVISACVLYGLALNYRIFRGVFIGLSYKGVNLIYLFLYFCALEFAPVIVLLKIIGR